jgi:hypothetical protein
MKQDSSLKVYNACPQLKLKYKFIYIPHLLQHRDVKHATAYHTTQCKYKICGLEAYSYL